MDEGIHQMRKMSNGRSLNFSTNLRKAIKQHAAKILANQFEVGPPYDPYRIAEELDVEVMEGDLGRIDGYVEVVEGKYVVTISATAHPVRKRFTLAHELCHVWLMRQASDGFPAPLIRYRGGKNLPGLHQDPIEEYLCNFFASELLMPSKELKHRLTGKAIHPSTVFSLARDFNVSKQTAAIQLANVFRTRVVACCLWSLESLWPLPLWWTGIRTPYQSEVMKIEAIVGAQTSRTELWEGYGTKRLRVTIDSEPTPRQKLAMVVIKHSADRVVATHRHDSFHP
jgi:Zn-dependent peptidase ImmA (M78 family)